MYMKTNNFTFVINQNKTTKIGKKRDAIFSSSRKRREIKIKIHKGYNQGNDVYIKMHQSINILGSLVTM